jgi:hypothetical protein
LLGAAAGVAALPRVLHSALAVALLVALNLPIDRQILGATFNGPLRELGERVGSDSSALLIHTDVQTPLPSWVQLPRARHVLLFPPEQEAWNPGAGVAEGESLSGSNDLAGVLGAATTSGPQGGPAPVWVVDSRTGAFHVPVWAITSHPGWRQVGPSELLELPLSWLKLDIARFEYTRP